MEHPKKLNIAFFGTPQLAVWVLEELEKAGIVPQLVVTNPDAPQGRKMVMTPPPVKAWAEEHGIEVLQPESLRDSGALASLTDRPWDLFLVAAYGKIIPKVLITLPTHGTLNVHPSLLPRFRGASPIRSAILADERKTGVSIMLLDEQMDHGPIVAQERADIGEDAWPMPGRALDERLARQGGSLLARAIPEWVAGNIEPQEQDHDRATYSRKITKADGEIDLQGDPYQNYLTFCAFDEWPGTYFFADKNGKQVRIKITDAELAPEGIFQINRVVPEGKKELHFSEWKRQN